MPIVEASIPLGMGSGKAELRCWESYRSEKPLVRAVDSMQGAGKGTYKATGVHTVSKRGRNSR